MPVTTIRGGRQINDGTVPYEDIQNVSAFSVLCNNTGSVGSIKEVTLPTNSLLGRGTGNITAITLDQGLNISGSQLQIHENLRSIAQLTYASPSFLKMTGSGTFSLDTNTYLTTNQTITLSGDATGSGTTSIPVTLSNSGVTAGTYNTVTVNAKGLVTSASNTSYITTYDETDTLASVTSRGSTTSTALTLTGGGTINSAAFKFYTYSSTTYLSNSTLSNLQVNSTNNGAAFISFSRDSNYSINLGLDPDNVIRFGGGALGGTSIWSLTTTGNMTVSGDIIGFGSPSDARYKEIIEVVPDSIKLLAKLTGYKFRWLKKDSTLDIGNDIGVIAQEVAEVFPELVRINADGYMSVRYQGLIGVLIEAVKDLQKQIDYLVENK